MATTLSALNSLVIDWQLYPRMSPDRTHVSKLAQALRAGAVLPPIIADEASKVVVDGIHRLTAYKQLGDVKEVLVEWRSYPDQAALFLDAVACNSTHGKPLDRQDQTRIALKLRELGVTDEVISMTLHVLPATVEHLTIRVVHREENGEPYPAKRGLGWMQGKTVTDDQIAVIKSVRSAEIGRLCRELSRLLDAELVDGTDAHVVAQLTQLAETLQAWLNE